VLAGELSSAKNALAEFEAKLATSEKYSADLANQVQTLLGEMASLQRETEVRVACNACTASCTAHTADSAQRTLLPSAAHFIGPG